MVRAMIPRRHPRFVFSLRTLLVATTAGGLAFGWIGYALDWIGRRHAALANGACAVRTRDTWAPAGLWLLGEDGAYCVFIPVYPEDADRASAQADRLERLFPEAIIEIHPNQLARPPLNGRRG